MEKNIVVIEGDGVGPEVVGKAVNVLNKIAEKYSRQESSPSGLFCVKKRKKNLFLWGK